MQSSGHTTTKWLNPTNEHMHVDVFVKTAQAQNVDGLEDFRPIRTQRAEILKTRLDFPPGVEVMLPSEYDRAIHCVRDGIVIGGGAPMLRNLGSADKLHPSLDPSEAERVEAARRAKEVESAAMAARAMFEMAMHAPVTATAVSPAAAQPSHNQQGRK